MPSITARTHVKACNARSAVCISLAEPVCVCVVVGLPVPVEVALVVVVVGPPVVSPPVVLVLVCVIEDKIDDIMPLVVSVSVWRSNGPAAANY